jgi:hypothetical protein
VQLMQHARLSVPNATIARTFGLGVLGRCADAEKAKSPTAQNARTAPISREKNVRTLDMNSPIGWTGLNRDVGG